MYVYVYCVYYLYKVFIELWVVVVYVVVVEISYLFLVEWLVGVVLFKLMVECVV